MSAVRSLSLGILRCSPEAPSDRSGWHATGLRAMPVLSVVIAATAMVATGASPASVAVLPRHVVAGGG